MIQIKDKLWRTHLLALLTLLHSTNLLAQLSPEQRAWRVFARSPNRQRTADVLILNASRAGVGVLGLRQINEAIPKSLIQTAALWQNATHRPPTCGGFKKRAPAFTPLIAPR